MLADLVTKNRSFRRFDNSEPISESVLLDLVGLARLCGSGGNLQPLKYKIAADKDTKDAIFECLKWAGYLDQWTGPEENERPTGYIVILRDNDVTTNFIVDHGIAAQTITLGAVEKGFGGCIVGSIDRLGLREALEIPNRYEILVVLALGKPTEEVVLEDVEDDNIRYWRDEKGVHHVPKRKIEDILL